MFKGGQHRQRLLRRLRFTGDELGVLLDVAPDIDPNEENKQAQQERNTPCPGQHVLLGQQLHQVEGEGGEHKAAGNPHLAPGGVVALLAFRRVLAQHQHAAAPFPAGSHALHEAQADQGNRRQNADMLVGWQQADQKGAGAHQRQGDYQRHFSAVLIAQMPEGDAAQRSGDKADGEAG